MGLGAISRYFATACQHVDGVSLVAVCDPDPRRRLPYQRAGVPGTGSLDALLSRRDVDAVIVSVPNDLHREVCAAALISGRHVCCEKPLAPTLKDAAAIADTARSHQRVLLTAFHRNFNKHFLKLADIPIEQICQVRVRYFEDIREHTEGDSWYLNPGRCGGGCLADNGPNALAMVRELIGPLAVRKVETACDPDGADQLAHLEIVANNGVTATAELDWCYPRGELKDVAVEMGDGSVHHADLLDGYQVFKSSLFHEYVGIVTEFRRAVAREATREDRGVEITRLIEAAYEIAVDCLVSP